MPAEAGTRTATMCGIVAAYLFRPPTGLADGLALKELALPPLRGGFAPTSGSPALVAAFARPLPDSACRQASRPAFCILPSASDGKPFSADLAACVGRGSARRRPRGRSGGRDGSDLSRRGTLRTRPEAESRAERERTQPKRPARRAASCSTRELRSRPRGRS